VGFVVWAKFSAKTAWRRRALRAVRVGENSHPRLGTNETKLIAQQDLNLRRIDD